MADRTERKRRTFLSGAILAAVGLAGCGGLDSDESADLQSTASPGSGTQTPAEVLSIEAVRQPESLPRIWKTESQIDPYQAVLSLRLEHSAELGVVINGQASEAYGGEMDAGSHQLRLDPRLFETGENTVKVTAGHDSETASISKQTPALKKLDFVPGENQKLRQQLEEELGVEEANDYLKQHSVSADHPVFTGYSTPETLLYNKYAIDLAALEWWHDNDFGNLNPDYDGEMKRFLESVNPDDDLYPEIENKAYEKARSPEHGIPYNYEGDFQNPGTFDFEKFANAATVHKAMDWLHPYLLNWESEFTADVISTEDEKFAAVIQEALDRYTPYESHVWAFDIPETAGSTHGNGLIYDETNDELMVLETIRNPQTTEGGGSQPITDWQHHPLIKNSHYLNPDWDEYSHLWHPLRFAEEQQNGEIAPNNGNIDFQTGKAFASAMFRGISTGYKDTKAKDEIRGVLDTPTVRLTTEYITDIVDRLRNYNENNFDFQNIVEQSKIYQKMMEDGEENYVIGGTVDNPSYVEGVSDQVLENIWNDQEGEYNDIDRLLQANPAKLGG